MRMWRLTEHDGQSFRSFSLLFRRRFLPLLPAGLVHLINGESGRGGRLPLLLGPCRSLPRWLRTDCWDSPLQKKNKHTNKTLKFQTATKLWEPCLNSVVKVAPFFFPWKRGLFGLSVTSVWLGAYPESLLPFGSARGAGDAKLATTLDILTK